MKAVVMAGGEGSRLRPLTSRTPKPLVPVAGRPIMEHILLHLRRHQMRDVVATVQYLGASIRNYFGDGSEQGVALSYSVEDSPLGTAGSVMLARQRLNETFVVISGDSLTDIDLAAAARFHRERRAIATIVLKPVPNPLEYGVVVVDEGGAVQRFIEKPSWGEVISDLANTGIYILEPAVFDYFRSGEVTDWSGDVFPKLLKEGEPVFGWVATDYWEDVGSHAAYVKANFDCLEGKVKVQIPADRVGDSIWIHPDAEVAQGARIDGPALICAGAKVRAGAWVNGPAVVGAYTTIDSGVKISNSITWDHSYIGLNSRLRGAVVCRSVTIKNGCLLEEGSVIGSDVVIGAGSTVNPNVRIWPNKEVEPGAVVHESIIWAGSWKRGLFSSYGLNGLINVEFTPEFASRLGASVGALAPKGTEIGISRDYTRSARMISRALMSGMISSGTSVTDLSVLPAPVSRYWARRNHVSAVHVQTSPVDPRSADIRIFDDHGLELDKRSERRLEGLFFREDIRRVSHYEMGRIVRRDGQTEGYIADMIAKLDLEKVRGAAFKVLIDYNNGSAATVLPPVLQEMNCTVIPLNASPAEIVMEQDEATFRDRLREMGLIVSAVKAKLGVFIDTPGERCFLVDESGTVLDHDEAFAVLTQLALAHRPGMVLGPASASLAFSMIAEQMQSRFVPTKITPGSVLRAAQHAETVVASDGAGGYCWPDFAVSFDAVFTTVRVLELLAQTGSSLRTLRSRIPAVAHRTAVEFCPWEVKGRVMRTMMEKHMRDRVDLTDGVKVFVDGGWVLVVPDADRPEYHIIASTLDPALSDRLVGEYSQLVRSVVTEAAPQAEAVVET
ncbi:MAG TPA: sugar phosphate nucleotidyltransferase [Candidatus Dormibacteraeota bacterium]|nr:sugar phosphate nucleotidyltransferase [Candidatus Dormibacteraeota bacterium]